MKMATQKKNYKQNINTLTNKCVCFFYFHSVEYQLHWYSQSVNLIDSADCGANCLDVIYKFKVIKIYTENHRTYYDQMFNKCHWILLNTGNSD